MAQHKPKTGTIVIAIILAAVFGLSFGIGSRIAYPPVRQAAVRYMLSHHTSNTNKQPVKSTDSIDLFIGDSTAQGATVDASKRWTKLFSDNDHAVERNYAIRGTGYVTGDQKQISFPYQYKKAVEELGNARKQVKRFFVVGFVNDTPLQSGSRGGGRPGDGNPESHSKGFPQCPDNRHSGNRSPIFPERDARQECG